MKSFMKKNYVYLIIGLITLVFLVIPYFGKTSNQEPITVSNNNNSESQVVIEYIYVDVKGYVNNPGVYKVEKDTRLFQVITKAGGLQNDADINAVNMSIQLYDEQVVYIPSIYDEVAPPIIIDNSTQQNGKININNASKSSLETLPGIGPSTAQKIIDYRQENGDYSSIEEIKNVPGIGEVTYDEIKDLITT